MGGGSPNDSTQDSDATLDAMEHYRDVLFPADPGPSGTSTEPGPAEGTEEPAEATPESQ